MSNEATKVEGPYEVHDFTVASGTAISASSLLSLADPRTAALSNSAVLPFAGIAFTEKEAGDSSTQLGLATTGTWLLTASGTIPAGSIVALSGSNFIRKAIAADYLSGTIVGKAYESMTEGTTGEVKVGVLV